MCDPILIGMAIGGGMAAIQGGGVEEIILGTVIGGVTAGVGAPGGGEAFSFFSSTPGTFLTPAATSAISSGFMGGTIAGMFIQPEPAPGFTPAAQTSYQNMNTNVATTGSGGRQAAKSLATAISRTKKRNLTQRDVGDLSLDTSSFTNTGLQLA